MVRGTDSVYTTTLCFGKSYRLCEKILMMERLTKGVVHDSLLEECAPTGQTLKVMLYHQES